MSERLSEQAFNALTELGNIGAGNATTSLSVMLNSKLTMSPPKVDIYDFNELENILGGPDATVMGVLSTIGGDMNAMILFVVGMEDAENLVKALMGDQIEWHSEIGISAIGEIANIIIGSYVASLETLTGMKMRYSQPESCIDMAGAILSVPCIEFGKISDKALLINSQFKAGEKEVDGYIMMMSEVHSFDALLNKLGIGGIDG
ncbi:MAG: CheY-P-specific phosphatase CheC [Lachnospiraceae bacterium]|nr:CheY-P-specific phosphatase CheC [Lachnospiraceae bacterium]MBQ9936034.1 chemotaxis protein CheC [Lachnospiraceae bacterium]